jgi:hypothetical protein
MAQGKGKAAADEGDIEGVKHNAGRDPEPQETAGDNSEAQGESGIRTSGGPIPQQGTVPSDQTVHTSDDAKIADIRTGVVADNQPSPK